jgi:hypothetical protein
MVYRAAVRVTTEFAPMTEFCPTTNDPIFPRIAAPNAIQLPCSMRTVPPVKWIRVGQPERMQFVEHAIEHVPVFI